MTLKKNILSACVVSGVLLAGWMFVRPTQSPTESPTEATKVIEVAALKTPVLFKKVTAPRKLESINQNIAAISDPEVHAHLAILMEYKTQSQKIFKLPEDQLKIEKVLLDYEKLQFTEKLLTTPNLLATLSVEAQDAAVDILIKSLSNADPKQSEELVLAIINDGQVENRDISQSVRIQMAAVKAELMYHGVTLDSRSIQNAISGPVTQKIWDNVQQIHASNIQDN